MKESSERAGQCFARFEKSVQPKLIHELTTTTQTPTRGICETLRHIELNGKLKELRERDAAAGR